MLREEWVENPGQINIQPSITGFIILSRSGH
jgi:hypothetical protein